MQKIYVIRYKSNKFNAFLTETKNFSVSLKNALMFEKSILADKVIKQHNLQNVSIEQLLVVKK